MSLLLLFFILTGCVYHELVQKLLKLWGVLVMLYLVILLVCVFLQFVLLLLSWTNNNSFVWYFKNLARFHAFIWHVIQLNYYFLAYFKYISYFQQTIPRLYDVGMFS